MKPPSAEELVGPAPFSLDAKWALKNFLGKTMEEAEEMYLDGPPVTEDFSYMTPEGLVYYLPSALSYLRSDKSSGDWDFAHGLMCCLSCQVELSGVTGPALTLIQQVADYCDANRTKFEMDDSDDLLDEYLQKIRQATD